MRFTLLLLLLLPATLFARKNDSKFSWYTDTLLLSPRENSCLDYSNSSVGTLEQQSPVAWLFHPETEQHLAGRTSVPLHIFRSPDDLFYDCVYFALNPEEKRTGERITYLTPPAAASMRFYTGNTPLHKTVEDRIAIYEMSPKVLTEYYQPFYFRKYEVTNKEYREFTDWVRDSVARRLLSRNGYEDEYLYTEEELWKQHHKEPGFSFDSLKSIRIDNWPLNWKAKIPWASRDTFFCIVIDSMFLSKTSRLFHGKTINTRKLVYRFAQRPQGYAFDTIGIYPDTLSWVNDFRFSFNEPMTNMYYWHPAYEDYPVVGLTYWQCLAFLDWKTKMTNERLHREKANYRVSYALPNEREWDMASTAQSEKDGLKIFGSNYFTLCDKSWFTDLQLLPDTAGMIRVYTAPKTHHDGESDQLPPKFYTEEPQQYGPYGHLLHESERTWGDFTSDRAFHTFPANRKMTDKDIPGKFRRFADSYDNNERYQTHFDKQTGIFFLDGNVSEWLRDNLDSNWRNVYETHRKLQPGPLYEQFVTAHTIEDFYYQKLPAHGRLIRGCNWYDERYSNKYGKNTAGQNAKTFEDPAKAHSTVGFRYVIYVLPENIQ